MEIISTQLDGIIFEISEPQINCASWRLIRGSSGTYAIIASIDKNEHDFGYVYEEYDNPDQRKVIDNMSDTDLIENVYNEIQESDFVIPAKKYVIEVAYDNEDCSGFVAWLNEQGHEAKMGGTTGSYVDNDWILGCCEANNIFNALWDVYCLVNR
jgi:hypothetical protein